MEVGRWHEPDTMRQMLTSITFEAIVANNKLGVKGQMESNAFEHEKGKDGSRIKDVLDGAFMG